MPEAPGKNQRMPQQSAPSVGLLVLLTFSFGFLILNGALTLTGGRSIGGLILLGVGVVGLILAHILYWRARALQRRRS
ncbi:hypothetical protein B0O41_3271 [Propionibacteriaceae bacterium ES.041]|nr:hypothetical protein B0O41_3271 [Propionibacteriaceae bacterium ES.041]TDO87661.1 hypothetical protein C8D81_3400 [Enemella evansiae]